MNLDDLRPGTGTVAVIVLIAILYVVYEMSVENRRQSMLMETRMRQNRSILRRLNGEELEYEKHTETDDGEAVDVEEQADEMPREADIDEYLDADVEEREFSEDPEPIEDEGEYLEVDSGN